MSIKVAGAGLAGRRPEVGTRRTRSLVLAIVAVALAGIVALFSPDALGVPVSWTTLSLVFLDTALAVVLPIWFQLRRGQFDPFQPLVFVALNFVLEMVFIRGLYLAFGGYSPWLPLTSNPQYYLDLALMFFALGWAGLMVGFYLPIGEQLARHFPLPRVLASDLESRRPLPLATFILALIPVVILLRQNHYGLVTGTFTGNQSLVSTAQVASSWVDYSFFLLVFGVARGRRSRGWWLALGFAATVVCGLDFLSGSRASLFHSVELGLAAYFYARFPAINWRGIAPWLGVAFVAGFLGLLVVTQYRDLRSADYGGQAISVSQTVGLLGSSASQVAQLSPQAQASFVGSALIDRLSELDFLSVTLARAPQLQQEERAVGINDNIEKEVLWLFVPRPLWPDKPIVGDFGGWFARLYLDFRYTDSSGPSPIGDLFRNFGPIGVLPGMFVVGVYLRFLYDLFIRRARSGFGAMFFFFLLITVNWEGEYASYITDGSRALFGLITLTAALYVMDRIEQRRQVRVTMRSPSAPTSRGLA